MMRAVATRDRVLLAALALVTAIAWLDVARMATDRVTIEGTGGVARGLLSCCGVRFGTTFLMWTVMMAAMMLPSTTPAILALGAVNHGRRERSQPTAPVVAFVAGYLLCWTAFSAVAAAVQRGLFATRFFDPGVQAVVPWLGAGVLVAAGLFQLSPWKGRCLVHCASPMGFLGTHWRAGWTGALRMGVTHGAYCVGCCWLLMALLFAVGVMNLLWVGALTLFVLAEKILPWKRAVTVLGAVACFLGAAGVLTWR